MKFLNFFNQFGKKYHKEFLKIIVEGILTYRMILMILQKFKILLYKSQKVA
jgi:hypothetical protein